ncbi:MAG: FKBP-type peptidyl-prolyl cis-trans isomerase [Pirellulaceae bacterium]|nr:FKBP-type peptidyl-prolyl cis-trans isomerase [Pirellulaceae bacterium]
MLVRGIGSRRFGWLVGTMIGVVCSHAAGVGLAQQGRIGDAPAGAGPATQEVVNDPVLTQQASYLLGQQIYNDFARDQVEINLEALIQGLQDAAGKKPSAIPADKVEAIMIAFFQNVQAKQQKWLQEVSDKNLREGLAFLKDNAVKPGVKQLENGVQYMVLQEGTGASPSETDVVTVHYVGSLIDGTEFESSVAHGEPATFGVNQPNLIEGWRTTIPRMKVGDKWRVFIPSNLAYREMGRMPNIQPNSTLIFELELLDVKTR